MRPPTSWHLAPLTRTIGIVTGLAWVLAAVLGLSDWAALWAGFIPARVNAELGGGMLVPLVLTPLTATLVHGGFVHVAFNLVTGMFCGRAVETIIGTRQFALLYVLGAYAAAAAHYAVQPGSMVPMIGASGAISAVIGAYAMLFGRNRVSVAHPGLAMWLNALWLAAAWIGLQLLVGITFETQGARIAIAAHVGGFLIGLVLAKPLLLLRYRGA